MWKLTQEESLTLSRLACLDTDCLSEAFSLTDSQPAGPQEDPQALDGTQTLGFSIQGADPAICKRKEQAVPWPGDSVGASTCTLKGGAFDSRSGCMPRFQVPSGGGACGRQLMDVSLSHPFFPLSLPPCLKIQFKKFFF